MMPQLVPERTCLSCDICCRFTEQNSEFRPFFSAGEKQRLAGNPRDLAEKFFALSASPGEKIVTVPGSLHNYRCPCFREERNDCGAYCDRPLDCRLYPFMLMYDRAGARILLCIDPQCPFVQGLGILENSEGERLQEAGMPSDVRACAAETARFLESGAIDVDALVGLVADRQENLVPLRELESLSRSILRPDLGLRKLTLDSKDLWSEHCAETHRSFTRSFSYHMLWPDFRYLHAIIDGCLCVFGFDNGRVFMPVPPLGRANPMRQCEEILRSLASEGSDMCLGGVDWVMEQEVRLFEGTGFAAKEKDGEYIYPQKDMADLAGGRFRKKRLYAHHFQRTHSPEWRPFEPSDTVPCLEAYLAWAESKQKRAPDGYHRFLVEDSLLFHKRLFSECDRLQLFGTVVRTPAERGENAVSGYTFGCPIDAQTFCILAEITDPAQKGASNWIFQQACRQARNYAFINTMDDSGLPTLRWSKLSYHPCLVQPLFQAHPVNAARTDPA